MSFNATHESPFDGLSDQEWERLVEQREASFRADRDFMGRITSQPDVIAFGVDNYLRRIAERGIADMCGLPSMADLQKGS